MNEYNLPKESKLCKGSNNTLPNKATDEDNKKMLTARINNLTAKDDYTLKRNFFGLAESENSFNAIHWTCWYNNFSKKITRLNNIDKQHFHAISKTFYEALMSKKISLNSGQNAVIISALGMQGYDVPALSQLLLKNAIAGLAENNSKEIVMLFSGGNKIFSKNEMNSLFSELEDLYLRNKCNFKFNPHVISTLLKTLSNNDLHYDFRDFKNRLIDIAEKNLNYFDVKELCDLILGLGYYTEKEINLLNKIEQEFYNSHLKNVKSLPYAVGNFAKVHYIPHKLIPEIQKILSAPPAAVQIWDEITLYHALYKLGYDSIDEEFYSFLRHLNKSTINGSPEWQKLYIDDQLNLLHAFACSDLSSEGHPGFISEMLNSIEQRKGLSDNQRLAFGEILRALDEEERSKQFCGLKNSDTPQTSVAQEKAFLLLSQQIQIDPDLHHLIVHQEHDVGGRLVDFLIEGFKTGNPLVCEVDGPFHFCCNDPTRPLGTNVLRNKILNNLGYDVFVLLSGKDKSISVAPLIALLKKKAAS